MKNIPATVNPSSLQRTNEDRRKVTLSLLGVLGGAGLLAGCAEVTADESSHSLLDDDDVSREVLGLSDVSNVVWFETYAELRGLSRGSTSSGANIAVGHAPGTAGVFVWCTDTTSSDDGGTIIVPQESPRTGCWKRVFAGPVHAAWFGVSSADDEEVEATNWQALEKAVDATPVNGTLILPGETIRISQGITIGKSINLDGRGTTLHYTGSGTALTIHSGGSLYTVCHLANLTVSGTESAAKGVVAEKLLASTWRNVSVKGFTGDNAIALELKGATGNRFYYLSLVHNYIHLDFTRGMTDQGAWTVPANENKFYGGRACYGVGPAAIRAYHQAGAGPGNQNGFYGFWLEGNAGRGFDLDYAFGWTIFDCRFEDNTGSNIRARNTYGGANVNLGLRVISSNFTSVADPIVHIELDSNHRYVAIVGNVFDSASTVAPWTPTAKVKAYANSQYAATESCRDVVLADDVRSNGLIGTALRGQRVTIGNGDESGAAGGHVKLTISAGAVFWDRSNSWIRVDTEGASSSDELHTIDGGNAGDVVVLMAFHHLRSVVVRHGVGNIYCGSDFALSHSFDAMMLLNDGFGRWMCISKQDNY